MCYHDAYVFYVEAMQVSHCNFCPCSLSESFSLSWVLLLPCSCGCSVPLVLSSFSLGWGFQSVHFLQCVLMLATLGLTISPYFFLEQTGLC